MKHISIFIPKGDISLTNVEGTYHILSEANEYLVRNGKSPLFKIQLVGLTRQSLVKNDLFTINADYLVSEPVYSDLVIIPAIHGNLVESLGLNREAIPWIIDQYTAGAEIASLCTSSFLLASTGLLNGRSCATHWIHANDFRKHFPEVNLLADKMMTQENGIYTSGAAYFYLNLLLYFIEKYAGREMAIHSSKMFAIDMDRKSQSPFMMFSGQKEHEDETIKRAQEFIEENFAEKITVDQLATMFALGRRSLERRFKKATSNSVAEYIQRVKIEAAKKSFETSWKNISEVMYNVGYSDTKTFRNIFKKITGLSPVDYRNKFSKETVEVFA